MTYNYDRAQRVAHRQILRFGASRANPIARGFLLREAQPAVPCTCAVIDYSPRERASGLAVEGARKALVSTIGLSGPPDFTQDKIGFNNEVLRIIKPVERFRGGSGVWIYYECEVASS